MRYPRIAVLLLTALAGCAAHRVRKEASLTLQCEESLQVLENRKYASWVAEGCGRQAFCSLPDVEDAEVQCAGGAPPRTALAELGS